MSILLCKDCRWHYGSENGSACFEPTSALGPMDLVYGRRHGSLCDVMRRDFPNTVTCGSDGKFWQQKRRWWQFWRTTPARVGESA